MKTLLTIHQQDIKPESPIVSAREYFVRHAVRAIVLDKNDAVFLLNVAKRNHHKLPGGGIEKGETMRQAVHREVMEELGCPIKIIGAVGKITEYRNHPENNMKQISYCYLARQAGAQVETSMEPGEIELGQTEVKAKNIDDAIAKLKADTPTDLTGLFIQKRDIVFLETAKTLIS